MKSKKINLVSDAKLDKYFGLTKKAIAEAKKHIAKEKEKEALIVIGMASCYLQDGEYFRKQGNYVNAFAAVNYAHGWLDAGSKLGLFDVSDSSLFVVK